MYCNNARLRFFFLLASSCSDLETLICKMKDKWFQHQYEAYLPCKNPQIQSANNEWSSADR